jgi:RHS repeat-associated protein
VSAPWDFFPVPKHPPPPRRDNRVRVYDPENTDPNHAWYWVKLHTSPDGRFAMQLYRSYGSYGASMDHVLVKSGDLSAYGGSAIPSFPYSQGRIWKFRHETNIYSAASYHTLIDQYSETRTVYSQSDQVYTVHNVPAEAINTNAKLVGQGNPCDAMYIRFVKLTDASNTIYGTAQELGLVKRSRTEYGYNDTYGTQIWVKEHGDVGVTTDDRTTHSTYANNTTKWIIGKVGRTNIYKTLTDDTEGQNPNWMASTIYFYDGQTTYGVIPDTGRGLVSKVTQRGIEGGSENGQSSSTNATYDTYGNPFQSYDPNNNVTTTWHDDYYHSFPTSVQHPNGRSDSTVWDYTLDMPSQTTDVGGVETQHRYDVFGRPARNWISSPTGFGSDTNPNARYTFPDINQASVTPPFRIKYEQRVSNEPGQREYAWQVRWFDGRGRTLQDVSPKDATHTIMMDTAYNINGQVLTKSLPYQITNTTPDTYIQPDTSKPKLTNEYDGVGRPYRTWNPDNTSVINNYDWLGWTGTYDESGHWKWQHTDMLGRLDQVMERDETGYQPAQVFTNYGYDALNNLINVFRDTGGTNQTISTIEYDGLGRKKAMVDPDMGRWEYEYDAAGNLTKQKDAIFLSQPTSTATAVTSHQVFFCYDNMNRIKSKFYGSSHFANCLNNGNNGTPDVKYYYDNDLGGPGNPDADTYHSWGKLRRASVIGYGTETAKSNDHSYEYDARGLLSKEIVTTGYTTRPYEIGYTYDIGGRARTVTYPDPDQTHEQVDLTYNEQAIGLPKTLYTNKSSIWPVVETSYNERGQITLLRQGPTSPTNDNLFTYFWYDDTTTKRGWLTETKVTSNGGNTIHLDLNIAYYANGNISQIANQGITSPVAWTNPEFTVNYWYDGLDRLRRAQSSMTGNYSMFPEEFYNFDSLGRMTERTLNSGTPARIFDYDTNSSAPKDGPDSYGNSTVGYTTYGYDANGNQITRTQSGSTQTRTFDPEGRITTIVEGNTTTTMIYDGNGQRIIKDVNVVTPTPTNTPTATPTNTPLPSGCQAVSWTSGVNVSTSGNSIQKTNSNNWDGGAVSSSGQSITSGNGYVQAKVDSTQYNVMFGLSNGNSNQGYSDIDFAAHLQGGGALMVYEGGTYKGTFGTYAVNDIIKVAVESGQVKYYKNGSLFYTSAGDVSYPLLMDSSIYEIGAWIKDALICSTGSGSGPGAGTGQDKTASTTATAIAGTSQGKSAGPAALNTVSSRTLYIGNLYEEDISNTSDPTPPYTSYYSFGGKLVGMRLANQSNPATDGQLRVVGDHLGSATLVIDTYSGTGGPRVIHRQFYKPYGEVALSSGSSRTSVGYTGQRLDTDSGLMFYNARFYDPVLSYFVSADTIAADKNDPKTRNRYSYVLNNPVKYNDPSGNCADPADDPGACQRAKDDLRTYGIIVIEDCWPGDCMPFDLTDLQWILEAIRDFLNATEGQYTTADDFKKLIGLTSDDKYGLRLTNRNLNGGGGEGGSMHMILDVSWLKAQGGKALFKYAFVHELAHVWDGRRNNKLSNDMHDEAFDSDGGLGCGNGGSVLGLMCDDFYDMGQPAPGKGYPRSRRGWDDRGEDWAEAVAGYVYPGRNFFLGRLGNNRSRYDGSFRNNYVRSQFGLPNCTAGVSCTRHRQ